MSKRESFSTAGKKLGNKIFTIQDSLGIITKEKLGLSDSFMGGRKVMLSKTAITGVYLIIDKQDVVGVYITNLDSLTASMLSAVAKTYGLPESIRNDRNAVYQKFGWVEEVKNEQLIIKETAQKDEEGDAISDEEMDTFVDVTTMPTKAKEEKSEPKMSTSKMNKYKREDLIKMGTSIGLEFPNDATKKQIIQAISNVGM